MPVETPTIDARDGQQVAREVELLARGLLAHLPRPWQPADGSDLGRTLARVFGHYAELVIQRLNRAPEKHFLAFLDLVGARLAPPRAARAPLVFELAPKTVVDVVVPAGTEVDVARSATGGAHVSFTTERDLVVSAARLARVVLTDPDRRRAVLYAPQKPLDATPAATLSAGAAAGERRFDPGLYLALPAFDAHRTRRLRLRLATAAASRLAAAGVAWSSWNGHDWRPLGASASTAGDGVWTVDLEDPPEPRPVAIGGRELPWLRARFALPDPSAVTSVTRALGRAVGGEETAADDAEKAFEEAGEGLRPEIGYGAGHRLDLSKDFLPFGDDPRPHGVFELASPVFAHSGADVYLDVRLARDVAPKLAESDVGLVWEGLTTTGWQPLHAAPRPGAPVGKGAADALSASGTFGFRLPEGMAKAKLHGVEGYWIRAWLATGFYGTPARETAREVTLPAPPREAGEVAADGDDAKSTLTWTETTPARPAPPRLRELRLKVRPAAAHPDLGDELAVVYEPDAEALYLAFSEPFAARPMTLYVGVAASPDPPERLVWEYWGRPEQAPEAHWLALGAVDETRGFSESGLVSILGPSDHAAAAFFGCTAFWIRARWSRGRPEVRRVLANAVWAEQATRVENEVLGASGGARNEVLRLARTDALEEPTIEVREPRRDTGEEWVAWRNVDDFHGSDPRSRHLVADAVDGTVRFGDGERGRIPPHGTGNVRASYRAGGGARGNVPAGTVTKLAKPVPGVARVWSCETALGGADAETVPELLDRAPRRLRHRGRAVTHQDFADLVRETARGVARAWVLGPRRPTEAGRVEVLVLPRSPDMPPAPTPGFLAAVREGLLRVAPATVDLAVGGPDWVRTTVHARLVPSSIAAAEGLAERAAAAARRLLDPLDGGPGGHGWTAEAPPTAADLHTLFADLDGVDEVRSAGLTLDPPASHFADPRRAVLYPATPHVFVDQPAAKGT